MHHHDFQYIHKSYNDYLFSNYIKTAVNAGIVGKIKINDKKNKNFRVIGLII